MSLVGPRPEQPWHAALMRQENDFYNLRLSVRPELTGWAQVNFGYGAGVEGARKNSPTIFITFAGRASASTF
jgi:lipopolysaccharide/colanic/teichoic acid biosynthesis glycosyltransferase